MTDETKKTLAETKKREAEAARKQLQQETLATLDQAGARRLLEDAAAVYAAASARAAELRQAAEALIPPDLKAEMDALLDRARNFDEEAEEGKAEITAVLRRLFERGGASLSAAGLNFTLSRSALEYKVGWALLSEADLQACASVFVNGSPLVVSSLDPVVIEAGLALEEGDERRVLLESLVEADVIRPTFKTPSLRVS